MAVHVVPFVDESKVVRQTSGPVPLRIQVTVEAVLVMLSTETPVLDNLAIFPCVAPATAAAGSDCK
jgi:hypothetical protein